VVVDTAGNGTQALELVERPYSIVLMTCACRLGGMELIAEVQRRQLPVT